MKLNPSCHHCGDTTMIHAHKNIGSKSFCSKTCVILAGYADAPKPKARAPKVEWSRAKQRRHKETPGLGGAI